MARAKTLVRSRLHGAAHLVPNSRGEISVLSLTADEAVTHAIEQARDAAGARIELKQLADIVNIHRDVLYDIASGRRPLRLNEVASLVRATRCAAPLDVVEHNSGRVGVALPSVIVPPLAEAHTRIATCVRAFGQVLTEAEAGANDGLHTTDEVAVIRDEAYQLIAALLGYVEQIASHARPSKKGSAR